LVDVANNDYEVLLAVRAIITDQLITNQKMLAMLSKAKYL